MSSRSLTRAGAADGGAAAWGNGSRARSNAMTVNLVAEALAPALGVTPQIRFVEASRPAESLRERNERARDERQANAEANFMSDPDVQRLISQHGAKVVPDSIRPYDEN